MKKLSILLTMLLVTTVSLFAIEPGVYSPYLEFSPKSSMRSNLNLAMQPQTESESQDSSQLSLSSHPDYILPKKVLLFSALVPGAGELYCKSYIKSAVFFGIEVFAWTMYATYNKKGKDKEVIYERYANDHWDEDKWDSWFSTLSDDEQLIFSHSLPEDQEGNTKKTQQYFEMIGKYNQFLAGWDDVTNEDLTMRNLSDYESPTREDYMDMRHESNKMFKKANNGAYIAMFNHVFSAIDAAWTAKRHNNRLIKTTLRLENKYFNNEDHTMLSLKITW